MSESLGPWRKLTLTPSNIPTLEHDEDILAIRNNVGLYYRNTKWPEYPNGSLYLTSLRLCYIDYQYPKQNSISLSLAIITYVSLKEKFLTSSPKIEFVVTHTDSVPRISFVQSIAPSLTYHWSCNICESLNTTQNPDALKYTCSTCGVTTNVNSPSSNPLDLLIECPQCTYHNKKNKRSCDICGTSLIVYNNNNKSILGKDTVRETQYKLSFRAGGAESFYAVLKTVVGPQSSQLRRSRESGQLAVTIDSLSAITMNKSDPRNSDKRPASSTEYTMSAASTDANAAAVGIHKLESSNSNIVLENQKTLLSAFQDLESLMQHASRLIDLASRLSNEISGTKASIQDDQEQASSKDIAIAQRLLTESNAQLGYIPMISKEMINTDSQSETEFYFKQLSNEISNYIQKKASGIQDNFIISLVDVWANFNRARGVDLVSPSDFCNACQLFNMIDAPFKIRTFQSGLMAIQSSRRSEDKIVQVLVDSIKKSSFRFITGSEGALILECSRTLAVEELHALELKGLIVRDEKLGIESRFYLSDPFFLGLQEIVE